MTRHCARTLALLALTLALSGAAHGGTVTFESAAEGPNFLGPVTEAGYTYATVSGSIYLDGYGVPIGGVVSHDAEALNSNTSIGGVLGFTAVSGDFTFSQLDYSIVRVPETITVTGYLGGVVVGVDKFGLASYTSGVFPGLYFTEHASNLAGVILDDLQITLPNNPGAFYSYTAIDNVVLSAAAAPVPPAPPAATPEPGSIVLLGSGLLLTLLLARRQRVHNQRVQRPVFAAQ